MNDDTRYVDFSRIEDNATHLRLVNWARYVRDHPNLLPMQPMFRNAKTPRTLDVDRYMPPPIDQLDGLLVEKTVRVLPERNRDALRWCYVYPSIFPMKMARYLGVSVGALGQAVRDGRLMLKNNLRKDHA